MATKPENDWIEWAGGECPVPENAVVDVRTPRATYEHVPAGDIAPGRWVHNFLPQSGYIIAYRVVSA